MKHNAKEVFVLLHSTASVLQYIVHVLVNLFLSSLRLILIS